MRGWWAAQGQRILELLSQNIDGTEPVLVTLSPKTHVNLLQVTSWQNTGIFVYLKSKMTEHEAHALFQHRLRTPGVTHSHSREVKDNHSFLPLATERLQLNGWGLSALFKGMSMVIHEGFSPTFSVSLGTMSLGHPLHI